MIAPGLILCVLALIVSHITVGTALTEDGRRAARFLRLTAGIGLVVCGVYMCTDPTVNLPRSLTESVAPFNSSQAKDTDSPRSAETAEPTIGQEAK